MATGDKKRPLPAKVAAMRDKKRKRLDGGGQKQPQLPAKKAKMVSRPDDLAWEGVAMPDHLDNYEGFFGIEEVDNVDIVKDASTGQVSYLSETAKTDPDDTEKQEAEWSGFADDDGAAIEDRAPKTTQPTPKAQKAKGKKALLKGAERNGEASANAPYEALGEGADAVDTDVSAWKPLRLSPDSLASLAKLRFAKPTPIQKAAIPEILSGHDVVGKASTGSGKTLAFGIPILERFLELRSITQQLKAEKVPLALIMSPTRELAHQLSKHLTALCSSGTFDGPVIATLTGGLSLQKQQRQLKDADIVIGTPGRLWEVLSSGHGTIEAMQRIHFLVVDEADRLLSEGHFKEVEEILNALDRQVEDEADDATGDKAGDDNVARQTLVFSATFDRGLQKKLAGKAKVGGDLMSNKESLEYLLSKLNFREDSPKFVDVNPVNQLASGLKEGLVECGGMEKDLYLYALLLLHSNTRVLVFTNSIDAVRRITPFLQTLNLPAVALHSGMMQKARLRSVERFTQATDPKKPSSSILVATDVAARGLDIPNVQLVIHYHLPRAADTYVHRSGRTARAGQPGSSVLICGPEEVAGVRRLVAKVHARSAVTHDQSASEAVKQGYYIRTLDIDRRIVSRLKPRATLAKKLADTTIAKEKQHKEDDFMRAAAEELGVDYDSEEFEKQASGKQGRGSGRKKKERESRELTKADVGAMKAELKGLLKQRVNVGVSERYLTSSGLDIDELLRQHDAGGKTGEFLGTVNGLGMESV